MKKGEERKALFSGKGGEGEGNFRGKGVHTKKGEESWFWCQTWRRW